MSRLKQYLSMETATEVDIDISVNADEVELDIEVPEVEPVTDEEVYEAEEIIEQAPVEEIEAEAELERIEDAADEAEREMTTLEAFRDILEHGIETQQFSPQMAGMVHVALEQYKDIFGDDENAVPSLENYTHENLGDYYQLALEDIGVKMHKVDGFIRQALLAPFSFVTNAKVVFRRDQVAKSLNKKADALLEELSSVSASGSVEVDIKSLKTRLAVAGTVPSNIKSAISNDQRGVLEILDKYAPEGLKFNEKLYEIIEEAIKQVRAGKKEAAVDTIATFARQMVRPEDKLAAGLYDGTQLLGNVKLAIDEPIKNTNDTAAQLLGEAKRDTPRLKPIKGGVSGVDQLSLSKSDVADLLKAVKQYAAINKKANDEFTRSTRGIITKTIAFMRFTEREGDILPKFRKTKEIQALRRLIHRYPNVVIKLTGDGFKHSANSASTLLKLAERAIKELKKSGTSGE